MKIWAITVLVLIALSTGMRLSAICKSGYLRPVSATEDFIIFVIYIAVLIWGVLVIW